MIEIAPKEYHIRCTYNEAILYCFSLNIDGKTCWRLPRLDEKSECNYKLGWCSDVNYIFPYGNMLVTPVRDIL
jgi:hypothetical protein